MATLQREQQCLGEEDVYHTLEDDETFCMDLASRPPVPVPRPETSPSGAHQLPDNEPYISKGKYVREYYLQDSSKLLSINFLDLLAFEP